MTDKLYDWEKWPLIAAFAAQGTYVFRWYLGDATVPAVVDWLLPIIHTAGGAAAAVSIEGAMIATVMGVRMGRSGRYSILALVVTAVFGAAVALNLYGALGEGVGAYLHAGFALTIVAYLLHLTQPVQQRAEPVAIEQPRERIEPIRLVIPTARQISEPSEVERVEELRRLVEGGMSIRAAAAQVGMSDSTAGRWLKRVKSEGEG